MNLKYFNNLLISVKDNVVDDNVYNWDLNLPFNMCSLNYTFPIYTILWYKLKMAQTWKPKHTAVVFVIQYF